jgi:aspartate racemase
LQIELPAATLFEHPTVQGMADEIELLRETGSERRRAGSYVVPIQPTGSRAPLFCVPPIGGTVYSYLALANHLGADQPVYGLQGTEIDGQPEPPRSIEQLADRYVHAIRGVQPAGPYLLAGWSLGGQIAFEMAQQITRHGEKVALVVLFDSFLSPYGHEFDADHWLREARAAGMLPQGSSADVQTAVGTHLQAWARHRPSPYDGNVLLFMANERDIFSRYRGADRWRALATSELEVKAVDANHFTLMHEPHIGPVAQHLIAAFDQALNPVPTYGNAAP